MAHNFNVFISWSGERSKWVATALHGWLPILIQAARPWMSAENIEPGSRGLAEVSSKLDGTKVGIACLTPENLTAPWILYECGALSKTVDDKTKLCTYLLGDLTPSDVASPLGMFQATYPDRDGTLRMVRTINEAVNEQPIPQQNLDHLFNRMWPELSEKLNTMPPSASVPAKRPIDDIVSELLEMSRAGANGIESLERQISQIKEAVRYGFGSTALADNPFNSLGGRGVSLQSLLKGSLTADAHIVKADATSIDSAGPLKVGKTVKAENGPDYDTKQRGRKKMK